jgi:UDP-N-acetylmuramate dehydrogenase
MSRHTSWRVGGRADVFFRPDSVEALEAFLRSIDDDLPLTWIGLGSNLLVRDGGIRGAVICTSGLPRTFEQLDGGNVRAGAGLPCATLARRCARVGLGPAAFFAGIPGTLGGALAMNAGAFGGETWDRVTSAETIDRTGARHERDKAEFRIAYRTVAGADGEWFLGATFRFQTERSSEAERIRSLLEVRSGTQPLGRPSAGSVFRNPAGGYAGDFIERAGLKGRRIGGAVVSTKHANFIVNEGGASAADIEALIDLVQSEVRERFGVELQTEVRIVGEPGERT